jgi:hypothetical protein
MLAHVVQTRVVSFVAREVFMRKWFIGTIYVRTRNAKIKFSQYSADEVDRYIDFEVGLWRKNDVRTHTYTTLEMFRVNLLNDNNVVEQHLNVIFNKVKVYKADVGVHGMSIIANAKDAEIYFPKALRAHLRSIR